MRREDSGRKEKKIENITATSKQVPDIVFSPVASTRPRDMQGKKDIVFNVGRHWRQYNALPKSLMETSGFFFPTFLPFLASLLLFGISAKNLRTTWSSSITS
ncbi:MAG TPA: hypothetical protein VK133_02500 [Amoebophilaceae bacterium]|nr:hypothetical protein [Amoebophilaceae bacterium]